jgi:hypothetical protein
MPDYSIPSWLQGPAAPNPASAFISSLGHGIQIGQDNARRAAAANELSARMAMEQQRLQKQIEQEQLAMTLKQQQQQQENLVAQQRLEVQKSYNEQRGDLQKQGLAQAQQKVDAVAKQAAAKFAAQNQYQNSLKQIQAAEDSGQITKADADHARRNSLLQFGPQMGVTVASLAAAMVKPNTEFAPKEVQVGDHKLLQLSPNRYSEEKADKLPASVATIPIGEGINSGTMRGSTSDPRIAAYLQKLDSDQAAKAAARAPKTAAPADDTAAPESIPGLRMPQGILPIAPGAPADLMGAPTGGVAPDAGAGAPPPTAPKRFRWDKDKKRLVPVASVAPVSDEEYLAANPDDPELQADDTETADDEDLQPA